MGIPYSKQINLAFDQVTPLVEAGFKVLQTTKNITFLLAAIQILTAVFLGLILIALVGLIITTSPDLEYERTVLVTPVVKWIVGWVLVREGKWLWWGFWAVIVGTMVGGVGGIWVTKDLEVVEQVEVVVEDPSAGEEGQS